MTARVLLLASLFLPTQGAAVRAASAEDIQAYEAFRSQFGRQDARDYQQRLVFFMQRRAEVDAQNAKGTWRAKVNKFADMTDLEYQELLGYRKPRRSPLMRSASLLQLGSGGFGGVARSRDWRKALASGGPEFLRTQGGCGSCWAVAAAGALEMHAEIAEADAPSHNASEAAAPAAARRLSVGQVLRCTPNPRHCGGEGGCSGATAELAFAFVARYGVVAEADWEPDGDDSGDHREIEVKDEMSGLRGRCAARPALRTTGFVKLPQNQLWPLLAAVSEKGPVVVSVDAEPWTIYDSGVFNGCKQDATINHAVLLVGYGECTEGKYWLIRNSWGNDWGENGYMRLLRHDGDEGHNGYCGTDRDPKVGVGCDGGPATLPVCGMCGILSDSSYPKL
ncbi:unnamed protein product [Effrenium voratum]|nr:unnamed protein product [Effrenium voratum]